MPGLPVLHGMTLLQPCFRTHHVHFCFFGNVHAITPSDTKKHCLQHLGSDLCCEFTVLLFIQKLLLLEKYNGLIKENKDCLVFSYQHFSSWKYPISRSLDSIVLEI